MVRRKIYQLQVVNGTTYRRDLVSDGNGGFLVKMSEEKTIPLITFIKNRNPKNEMVALNRLIPGVNGILLAVKIGLPKRYKNIITRDVIV